MTKNKKIFKGLDALDGGLLRFNVDELPKSPGELFLDWFRIALDLNVIEPQSVVVSTVNSLGAPSSRVLTVRDVSSSNDSAFFFSTSGQNPASNEIKENPNVVMTFFWREISRVVIVRGVAAKQNKESSKEDLLDRGLEARAISSVGKQSLPLDSISTMHIEAEEVKKNVLKGGANQPDIDWALYKIIPTTVEFVQARKTRMHERVLYERKDEIWTHKLIWA